eukprot:11490407-Ditylum_brightwellii.AAC.1
MHTLTRTPTHCTFAPQMNATPNTKEWKAICLHTLPQQVSYLHLHRLQCLPLSEDSGINTPVFSGSGVATAVGQPFPTRHSHIFLDICPSSRPGALSPIFAPALHGRIDGYLGNLLPFEMSQRVQHRHTQM